MDTIRVKNLLYRLVLSSPSEDLPTLNRFKVDFVVTIIATWAKMVSNNPTKIIAAPAKIVEGQ